jgi:hypothetical protein
MHTAHSRRTAHAHTRQQRSAAAHSHSADTLGRITCLSDNDLDFLRVEVEAPPAGGLSTARSQGAAQIFDYLI